MIASPAFLPIAILEYPVVKPERALLPIATFFVPVLYGADVVPPVPALAPTKVFSEPLA